MTFRDLIFVAAGGLFLALLSSVVPGRGRAAYSEIMGCEQGCEVAAAGWPVPYLVDYPGISVSGSAGLGGALGREDHFRLLPFCQTALFWMAAAAALLFLWRLARRRIR
jgi:hypothetical protein